MIKPFIPGTQQEEDFSFTQKLTMKAADGYAKLLWKNTFKKSPEQEEDRYVLAIVQEVYKNPSERQMVIGNWKLDENFNELFHAVYVHMDKELIVICYRGTDFANMKDLFSDIQIVLGINVIDMRVRESRNFYDQVTIKYPLHKKRLTGHSLWGTISYLVTKHRNPERCIVFNPGAGPTKGFISMMQDTLFRKPRTKKITTYRILGDAVSTLAFVGNVKTLFLKTVDPMKLHGINSFTELLNGEQSVS